MEDRSTASEAPKYALTAWATGERPRISIDAARYAAIADAEAVQVATLQIEEKFDLVIANYEEFETELAGLTIRHMIRRDLPWRRMSADRLMLNRRLANLLSTCRLYTDQVIHDLTAPPMRLDLEATKRLFSSQYDASLGFRVMEGLRNLIQHRSIPITGITYASTTEDDLAVFRIDLALNIEMLAADGFKASVLKELNALEPDKIDLILFVREHVQGLAAVHEAVRTAVRDQVIDADSAMTGAAMEWDATGRERTALAAVEIAPDGTFRNEIYIGNNLRDRRNELASANQSLNWLSRRYITSSRPKKAYT